jgi:AraC-like DNA-binding protein
MPTETSQPRPAGRPISRPVDHVTAAPRRRVYTLAYEEIHPVIRIAHRMHGPLRILQRIIFDHELVLVLRGSARYETAEQTRTLNPGDLLFIPPFEPHRISGSELVEHVAVHFDLAPGVPKFSSEPTRRPPYEVRLTDGLFIPRLTRCLPGSDPRHALDELLRQRASENAPSVLGATVQLMRVLVLLLGQSSESAAASLLVPGELRNRERINRTIRYIQEHLPEPIDVDLLSELAGLSPSHLTRLFRELTGRSPMDYLRRARVQQARQLLGDVDLSIKEIASRVGFDDPYHFSKVFHRIDGLPPSLYREALLAGTKRNPGGG